MVVTFSSTECTHAHTQLKQCQPCCHFTHDEVVPCLSENNARRKHAHKAPKP